MKPATWRPQRHAAPIWLAVLAAAISGPINAAAFPGRGWWPLVFLGTGLMIWSLAGRRIGSSLLLGLIGGFTFWGTHIFWLTIYLGPVPWLALAGLQTIFFALGMVLIALAWNWVPRLWPGVGGRLGLLPVVLGALWSLRESITSVWPYGGFSWGRLAFSQSESPFGSVVAWFGISGLSFLLAWLSALLVQALRESAIPASRRGVVASAALFAVLALPTWPVVASGSIRVAAVQGDSDAGLFAQHVPGQTLNDHIAGTIPLFGENVDVVVWPENASDLNPLTHPNAARALDYISSEMDAPLVTGTITGDSEGHTFNSLLLWEAGRGAVDQYDKIHPVPFAEYLPDRAFWYPFAPALFDLVPRDYTIGTRDNIFDLGGVRAGLAICFDIVDDALVAQMIDDGAQLILAPTNNADFGRTDENVQQLAIARLRAIETNRSVVQVSTVGVSAIFAPDGRTIARLPIFEPGSMVESVPLSRVTTLARALGPSVDLAVGGFGLTALTLAMALSPRRSRGSRGQASGERRHG
ncbi:apolipoprotein N-acyltransferase [Leifsonia bigeumensis]|uniref:Apolipoprotein N-acyltransferase n=1 Tax=Leifsonella bigeumensis TaxID=433643 RepID=A0ABP7FP15_9MICO